MKERNNMTRYKNIGSYYWQLLRKGNMFYWGKLPKRFYTRFFKTKNLALRFAAKNKHKWIQATLLHNKSLLEIEAVATIDTTGKYKKEYLWY